MSIDTKDCRDEKGEDEFIASDAVECLLGPAVVCLCNDTVPSTREALAEHLVKKHAGLWPYVCEFCDTVFDSRENLKAHLESHANDKSVECRVCGLLIVNSFALKSHQEIHSKSKYCLEPFLKIQKLTPFVCSICKMQFANERYLKLHNEVNHDFKEQQNHKPTEDLPIMIRNGKMYYCCEVCGKKTQRERKFRSHLLKHKDGKKHQCEECGMDFHFTFLLHDHMVKEHPDKMRFICTCCSAGFMTKWELNQHSRTHKKIQLKCPVCEMCFSSKEALKSHKLSHKTYQCPVCDKKYTRNSSLELHRRTHTGYRPYKCSVCGKCFTSKNYLKSHSYTHTGERPFVCSICEKGFTTKSNLNVHLRIHTGEKPFQCKQCLNNFTCLSSFKLHQKVHEKKNSSNEVSSTSVKKTRKKRDVQQCGKCNKKFLDSDSLMDHLISHTLREIIQ